MRSLERSAQLSRRDKMIRPGLEPGPFCVLDRCDNQLRHRTVCLVPLHDHGEGRGQEPISTVVSVSDQ